MNVTKCFVYHLFYFSFFDVLLSIYHCIYINFIGCPFLGRNRMPFINALKGLKEGGWIRNERGGGGN